MTSKNAATQAQAAALVEHIRGQTIRKLSLFSLAVFFAVIAAALTVLTPEGRKTATSIVMTSFFVPAVGCAGFGAFAIRTP
jgi:hypothetical protein